METVVEKQKETLPVNQVVIDIPSTDQLGALKTMETGFNMNPKYRTKEEWISLKGQEVRAFFLGLRELPNDEGDAVICGAFSTEKEIFFAGQKVLIDAVRSLEPKTPVSITFTETRKNKSSQGSTMIFEVKLLQ